MLGGRVDSFSAGECVCKEVKLVSALGADELGTFQLTPQLNSPKTIDCVVLSLDLFVPLRLRCLLAPKLVCLANQFVPPPPTEHDTRVIAKERQKKDNHNLSKYSRLLLNQGCLYVDKGCPYWCTKMRRIVPITVILIFVTHEDKKKGDIFVQTAWCSSFCFYSNLKH